MRCKKIHDDILLEMIRSGKSQREVAEHLGCSPVAVCRRLKRLVPPPESLGRLTPQQQAFCREKAKGKTNTQAAMASYEVTSPESAKSLGSQLMNDPDIQSAISQLMEYHGLTRSYRVQRLKAHVDSADPIVSLKGIDLANKMDNSYPPQRSVNLNIQAPISPVDLSKYRNVHGSMEDEN